MEGIRQWAFSLCAAMVAAGLARMLLPRAGMDKVFQTTVSVFFLCCLLSPIALGDAGLRIEVQEYAQADIERRAARLTEVAEQQAEDQAGGQLKKIVSEKLAQMGINYQDITISMNRNGQNTQEQLRVDILLDEAHEADHKKIREELVEALGVNVYLGYAPAERKGAEWLGTGNTDVETEEETFAG